MPISDKQSSEPRSSVIDTKEIILAIHNTEWIAKTVKI